MIDLKERLEANVTVDSDTGCWNWVLYKDRQGYGKIQWRGAHRNAHRLSFEVYNGSITEEELVRHTCDNPSCINPAHLLKGTPQENADDMKQRGRSLTGGKHPQATITWDTVRAIRSEAEDTYLKDIASKYSLSISQTHRIRRNQSWVE